MFRLLFWYVPPRKFLSALRFTPLLTFPFTHFPPLPQFHGESRSSGGNAINGKIFKVSGANLDVVETIVSGLPVADMDHGKQPFKPGPVDFTILNQ